MVVLVRRSKKKVTNYQTSPHQKETVVTTPVGKLWFTAKPFSSLTVCRVVERHR